MEKKAKERGKQEKEKRNTRKTYLNMVKLSIFYELVKFRIHLVLNGQRH
jgi:hypothetical protein